MLNIAFILKMVFLKQKSLRGGWIIMFEGNEDKANLFLRIGVALTLLWSVKTKFGATNQVTNMMDALGLGFMSSGLVIALGILLAIVSIMLIVGWQVRTAGLILTVFFAVSMLAGMFAGDSLFSVGPAIWKDFGLLGGAIALMLGGAGAKSIDEG